MKSTVLLDDLIKLKSPIPGRTFISLYMPPASVGSIISQLAHEVKRTEKSSDWKVKGAVIMLLKEIIEFLQVNIKEIIIPGLALFAVPLTHQEAIIHLIKPSKSEIDLFQYVLDFQFFLISDYF